MHNSNLFITFAAIMEEKKNEAQPAATDEQSQWRWQEPGTAWRGVGVYHVTLTVPSREPLFGTLVIPDGDPRYARIERTALGNAVIDELYVMCRHYPEIRILQFCLMPDHLHFIIRVMRVMKTSIRSVIRGYWQGVKRLGRAHTLAVSAAGPALAVGSSQASAVATAELNSAPTDPGGTPTASTTGSTPTATATGGTPTATATGSSAPLAAGGYPFAIFTERPFIRPLSRRGQLNTMMHYVQMNPQRLATKRMRPGFFRVQRGIEIAGRQYDGVGNMHLLMEKAYAPVHVRGLWVDMANHGDNTTLRNYMNGCVLQARKSTVMVSPFISTQEKMVEQVLLREGHQLIVLVDNGFREYYKPTAALFDACAAGRVLILSPWAYDGGKRHISRAECVALNAMAEEICQCLNGPEQ